MFLISHQICKGFVSSDVDVDSDTFMAITGHPNQSESSSASSLSSTLSIKLDLLLVKAVLLCYYSWIT